MKKKIVNISNEIRNLDKKWCIVGFNHPAKPKSLIYKQGIKTLTLLRSIEKGIELGCNLFSIREYKKEI